MTTLHVYRSPRTGIHRAIKCGFNWPASFFPHAWMLVYQIPRPGFPWFSQFYVLAGTTVIVRVLLPYFEGRAPWIVPLLMGVSYIGAGLLGGLNGNKWHVLDLERKDWKFVETVDADSTYKAVKLAKESGNLNAEERD